MLSMSIIYKAAGFCFTALAIDRILVASGKSELAHWSHIIGWFILAGFSIKFALPYIQSLKIGW